MTKSPRGAGRLDWSVLPTAARVGTGCSVKRRRRVPRGASYGIQFRPPVLQGEAWQVSPPEGDFVRVAGDFNPRRACCLDIPIPVAIATCMRSCSRCKVGFAPITDGERPVGDLRAAWQCTPVRRAAGALLLPGLRRFRRLCPRRLAGQELHRLRRDLVHQAVNERRRRNSAATVRERVIHRVRASGAARSLLSK